MSLLIGYLTSSDNFVAQFPRLGTLSGSMSRLGRYVGHIPDDCHLLEVVDRFLFEKGDFDWTKGGKVAVERGVIPIPLTGERNDHFEFPRVEIFVLFLELFLALQILDDDASPLEGVLADGQPVSHFLVGAPNSPVASALPLVFFIDK